MVVWNAMPGEIHFCVSQVSALSFLPCDSQREFWLLLCSECLLGLGGAEWLIALRDATLVAAAAASSWFFTSAACTESPPHLSCLSWSSPSEQVPLSLPVISVVMQHDCTKGTLKGLFWVNSGSVYSLSSMEMTQTLLVNHVRNPSDFFP